LVDFTHNMINIKDNRTLRILDAAAAGNYGILSAIVYALMHQSSDDRTDAVPVTM